MAVPLSSTLFKQTVFIDTDRNFNDSDDCWKPERDIVKALYLEKYLREQSSPTKEVYSENLLLPF